MNYCLVILIFAVLSANNLFAAESIEIKSNPDAAYLPYEFNEFINENWAYKQRPIQRPTHVLEPEYGDSIYYISYRLNFQTRRIRVCSFPPGNLSLKEESS